MDLQRSTESFLSANGINLSVPISKDASRPLVALNVRPDRRSGRIRSRLGLGAEIDTFPASVHSIWLAQGSTRYIGAGTVLYRGGSGSSIVTGLDGRRLFLASVEKFTWIMNRNAQKKDDGSTVTDWWIAPPGTAPSVATGAAGVLDGTSPIVYYISYENAAEHESSVGPGSTPVVFTLQQANLTSIPTGPAGTAKRHIYRIGGGLDTTFALRVATINDNTTTTYTDNIQNEVVRALNIEAPTDREEPPPASGICHYYGRLVGWASAEYPNKLFWTPPGRYYYFRSEDEMPVGDYYESILACSEIGGSLCIFKERSVWRLIGDPDNRNLELVTTEIGLPGASAIAVGRTVVPYLSRKGAYLFNGDRPVKLSGLLDPLFNGEGVATGSGEVAPAINLQHLDKAVLEISDGYLWLSMPGGASTSNTHTMVCDLEAREWVHFDLGLTAMSQEGVSGSFVVAEGTKLFYVDNGQTDDGADITLNYQTAFLTFGAPDNDKQLFEVRIKHTLGSQVISLKLLLNEDTVTTPIALAASITGNGETRIPVNSATPEDGIMCRSASLLIEGSLDAEIEIEDIAISYFVHPRKTLDYVTAVRSDLQFAVHEARQIQVEVDAGTADMTFVLRTDGASGGDISSVESLTHTVTGTVGRRSVPKMLAAIQVGRLWQMAVRSTSEMRVYAAQVEMQRIPVYLDGTKNQYFEIPEISLGA